MNQFISKIILKFFSLKDYLTKQEHLRILKQNPKSKIDPSFKLGYNNFMDISRDAVFSFDKNVFINESNNITVKKNGKLTIGENTYITRATISVLESVEIGKNCILGEGMKVFDHNHQYTSDPFYVSKTEFDTTPIKIGNNVWTGANCIILKGVTIGDNVILGAGCVIHKDIPSNSIIINKQEHLIRKI